MKLLLLFLVLALSVAANVIPDSAIKVLNSFGKYSSPTYFANADQSEDRRQFGGQGNMLGQAAKSAMITRVAKTEKLPPVINKEAKREKTWYGPVTLPALNVYDTTLSISCRS
jgi:hypothetical protein